MTYDRPKDQVATLLSASCTTSMRDWIHGELWLCSDGLLRRALGLRRTILWSSRQVERSQRTFSSAEIETVIAASKSKLWIPRHDIVAARVQRRQLQDTLILELPDGSLSTPSCAAVGR